MEDGQKVQLTPKVEPSSATQTVSWKSSRTRVATVDSNGVVTAHAAGTAYITATSTYSAKKSVRIKVTVTQKAAPSALSFPTSVASIYVGKSAQIAVQPQPATASVMCQYTSSNPSIASVDQNGNDTTHRVGVDTISARSLKNSKVSASVRVVVYDDNTPGSVKLESASLYLGVKYGDYLGASVFPSTASQTVIWSSANPKIATVDQKGYVYGKAIGTTTVTATAVNGVSASCTVYVTSTNVSGVIPARTTTVAGISENLGKIYAIQDSALDVVASLNALGAISGSEASARSAIIRRAMADQAFPWMTLNTQEYWTQRYAEKRYLPGRVYYGLPYTQAGANGNSANRTYTAAKALNEKRYYDSGKGYYILNQKKLLNGSYAGCDCSFFVNTATYGLNHPASALKTYTMNTSNYYKTLRSYSELRPGDHIVLAKSHTVMFLYWMDAEKTKFMIIEQGGDGNTVICSIKNASEYASKGYIPRRVSSFS
ncbi:MAG: Ig-like domain-containing protein, partial [Clostridiales bacterium]|nr:Ig-like domain-containing protein [Clostridiales bacterium]